MVIALVSETLCSCNVLLLIIPLISFVHEDFNREYPGCKAPEPSLVGDGQCNGSAEYVKSPWGNYFNEIDSINPTKGLYNTPECKFDGGDCTGEFHHESFLNIMLSINSRQETN